MAIFLRTLQEDVVSCDWSSWNDNLPEDITGGCYLLWLVTMEWQSSWGHCRRMWSPLTGHLGMTIFLRTLQEYVISRDWAPWSSNLPEDITGGCYLLWLVTMEWQSSWGHCRRMWSPVTGHHGMAIFLRTLQEDVVSCDWSPWNGNLPEDIARGCYLQRLVTMEWQSSWGHCRRMWSPVTGHHGVAIFQRTLQEDVVSCDWSPWSDNLPEDIAGGCGLLWLVTMEWQSSWGHYRRMWSPVTGHHWVTIFLRTLQEDVISCDWSPWSDNHGVTIFLRTLQEDVVSCDWSPLSDNLPEDIAGGCDLLCLSPWSDNLPEDITGGCDLLWLVTTEWQSSWGHCRRMLFPVTGHHGVTVLL